MNGAAPSRDGSPLPVGEGARMAARPAPSRDIAPNILFVLTDDQGP